MHGILITGRGKAMDGIAITTERIATAGAGVSEVGDLLTREIATMGDLLAQVRSGWQSDTAAPQFAATMQSYLDQAGQLTGALLSHGATLSATAHKFAEAESALGQGLGGAA